MKRNLQETYNSIPEASCIRNRKSLPGADENDKEYIRPFPLWGMIACGIIIIIMGIYCYLTNQMATDSGILNHTHYGSSGPASLNGETIIVFGILLCIFPVYFLIKQRKQT